MRAACVAGMHIAKQSAETKHVCLVRLWCNSTYNICHDVSSCGLLYRIFSKVVIVADGCAKRNTRPLSLQINSSSDSGFLRQTAARRVLS
jgi:hypothetical protein